MSDLSKMKPGNAGVIYIPFIPVQRCSGGHLTVDDVKTRYSLMSNAHDAEAYAAECLNDIKHEEKDNDVKVDVNMPKQSAEDDYVVLSNNDYRAFCKLRIDESKDSEWQCPTCMHRVKNLQRERAKDGNPCWGCRKFCDTVDASYFGGKACRCYKKGDSSKVWW